MTEPNPVQSPPADILVPVPLGPLEEILSHFAASGWTRADKPSLGQAWDEVTAARDAALGRLEGRPPAGQREPAPPLPPGEWARVEIMGHDSCTGWVSEGTRAGVPVMVIRDHDGRVMREVPGQSLYQFVPLPTPLHRPQPGPLAALPAGPPPDFADYDGHSLGEYDDGEPADAFAGRPDVEPF